MFKRTSRREKALLPWYANGTLVAGEQVRVARWLSGSRQAQAELVRWQQLQAAVAHQKVQPSPSAVRQRLLARVRSAGAKPDRAWSLTQAAWSGALALAIVLLLWTIVPPGVMLRWSASDGPMTAFRLYRAPLGSNDFKLVGEIPAQPAQQQYTYVDSHLWPGQTYIYVVEGQAEQRQSIMSGTVTASALEALPAQVSVLLVGLVAGCGAAALLRRWQPIYMRRASR